MVLNLWLNIWSIWSLFWGTGWVVTSSPNFPHFPAHDSPPSESSGFKNLRCIWDPSPLWVPHAQVVTEITTTSFWGFLRLNEVFPHTFSHLSCARTWEGWGEPSPSNVRSLTRACAHCWGGRKRPEKLWPNSRTFWVLNVRKFLPEPVRFQNPHSLYQLKLISSSVVNLCVSARIRSSPRQLL